uniref:Xylanolytic transcriptional activator regulatory domain-containing protein n=1 Tax=Kwoniella bestiolae CBS 10118 TaxID=1296100 RepID=A0A1B9FV78_9TREE|nr:hypothetical protein I302_08328 [Kwoniella bestiolae CBS 10118]OCF22677.1 hypothetical protein I302_08328 [Kwoniella bestiolae CBS 10118]
MGPGSSSSTFRQVQLPSTLNMSMGYSIPPPPIPQFSSTQNHAQQQQQQHNPSLSPDNRRFSTGAYPPVQPSPRSSEAAEASGTNRNLDLSEYLDPADRPIQLQGPSSPFFLNYTSKNTRLESEEVSQGEARDDPVNLMILSESEALALVQLFHDRLNHLVAVLDAKLHTLSYLRSTSTILFSAVLSASSKFARPDLHSTLVSHTQTLLSRAINNGTADVGVAQTIMILMYWKLPADTSSWRKIGIAIRMGYQLYWHVPRNQVLPDDEVLARKILNSERTWMCLFCFDRSLAQTYGLPFAIQPSHMMDAGNWAREHTYLGPSVDVHLASSIELCKLKDQWRAICDSSFQSLAYNDAALESVHAQCEALLSRYWRKDAPPPGFEYEKEHVGLWATLDFMLTLKRHHLEASPNDPIRIDACLSYASRITDEIDAVADNGDLEIMQDTSSVMASSLTVLLRKIFHLSSITQKLLIITLLQRILAAYTKASGTEHNTAPAYVARFVQRTLRAIGMESKAGSPMRDPMGGTTGTGTGTEAMLGGGDQPDFMAQLQQFMGLPDETLGMNDDDYW